MTSTERARRADAKWYKEQLQDLIRQADDNIKEDGDLAEMTRDDADRAKYLARVESDTHWKRALQRVLDGKTFAEDLAETIREDTRRNPP